MSSGIPHEVRTRVSERAATICEYCLIHEDDTFYGCQVDHIISLKHGGPTDLDNLAYACAYCNRQKGSDLGSILWETGELVRFFNPRRDSWPQHFKMDDAMIHPLTPVASVTVSILRINHVDRIIERRTLIAEGRYPSPAALRVAHG